MFVGEESFNVTEPNDLRFYEYLYQRCIAEDEGDETPRAQRPRRPGLIARLFQWMAKPI